MTDNPISTPPRPPLQLPPNCINKTAERTGTVMVIVGAERADHLELLCHISEMLDLTGTDLAPF